MEIIGSSYNECQLAIVRFACQFVLLAHGRSPMGQKLNLKPYFLLRNRHDDKSLVVISGRDKDVIDSAKCNRGVAFKAHGLNCI